MAANDLHEIAKALVADEKGILAADESSGTIEKRFDSIKLESTEENRRAYRDMLFTTPGLEEFVSGVILYDETLRQSAADGTPFAELLSGKGIVPGIKVDIGAKALAGAPGETVTEGLDGLRERLEEYRGLGAQFAKWRAVIAIGEGIPTAYCIETNAHALARYAALCQEQGIVPIVEPEVLMDGDHDIETCYRATKRTLHKVFDELYHQRIDLEGMLLEAEHGPLRKGLPDAGECGRGGRLDAEVLPRDRFLGRARNRLPLRRTVRRAGDREPERDQLTRSAALGALVLVRPCAAGTRVEGVGRVRGRRRGRPVVPCPTRPQQQRRRSGALLGGDGGARPLELAPIQSKRCWPLWNAGSEHWRLRQRRPVVNRHRCGVTSPSPLTTSRSSWRANCQLLTSGPSTLLPRASHIVSLYRR